MQQDVAVGVDSEGVAVSSQLMGDGDRGGGKRLDNYSGIREWHKNNELPGSTSVDRASVTRYVGVFLLISLMAMSTPITPRMSWF